MKRTVLAAVLVVAMVFGVVAYANAEDKGVEVTATVNSAWSMTINQIAVDFGAVAPPNTYTDSSTAIIVKSNRPWDFSKTVVEDATIAPYLSDTTSVAIGTGLDRGVTSITATYDLDLSSDAAWAVPADATYTSNYTYTALQQIP